MRLFYFTMTFLLFTSCKSGPELSAISNHSREFYNIPSFFNVEVLELQTVSKLNNRDVECYEFKLDLQLKALEDLATLRPERPFGQYRLRTTKGDEYVKITNTLKEIENDMRFYQDQVQRTSAIRKCTKIKRGKCVKYKRVRVSKNYREKLIHRKVASTKKLYPHSIMKDQNTVVKNLPIIMCQNQTTGVWN